MGIIHNRENNFFLLQGRETSYSFGIGEKCNLLNLHWGSCIEESDIRRLIITGNSCFDPDVEKEKEEYPGWGGPLYTEPCLKLEFSDGVRDLRLCYKNYQIIQEDVFYDKLVVELEDEYYKLKVRLIYKLFERFDIIERYAEIENCGKDNIIIENVQSACWIIPQLKNYRLRHTAGKWTGENQLRETYLTECKMIIESRKGFTSHGANPWFSIDNGSADEDQGRVWFGALAWSGNWKISAEKTIFNNVKITGGINEFDFRWQLKSGDKFTTPSFFGGHTRHGFGEMSRLLHQYQNQQVLPSGNSEKPRKIIYNSWEATAFDVNFIQQARLAEKASKMGVELFVMDDGWFGKRNNDLAGLGDWYVNPEKFPDGLTPLIEKVNSLGMDFGIWVEPEMVNPDSDLYRKHPDWVYQFPNRTMTLARNQLVLNLCIKDVRDFILDFMTDLLGNNNIRFIKWDCNRVITEPGWMDAPPAERREIWVRHTKGLYEIMDALKKNFPDVVFESCAGGGGRVDLGIMRYFDQFWVSDNSDPFDRLKIQEGFSLIYTPKTMVSWVTDSPNPVNHRITTLRYRFHSAMTGVLGIGSDLNKWTEEESNFAAEMIRLYKDIRHIIQDGKLYRLISPAEDELSALQYVDESMAESVLFVFLHSPQFRNQLPAIKLKGLKEDSIYKLDFNGELMSARTLMQEGINVSLNGDFDSALIRLKIK